MKHELIDTDTGERVELPVTKLDFRGDDITVIGFEPPRHSASTGRIYTDNNREYFPSVAGLKIVPSAV